MKVKFFAKNKSSHINQIIQFQVILELSQIQEILSTYNELLLFFAKYGFLFENVSPETQPLKTTHVPVESSLSTQDPARDGVNWWNYCNSNPIRFTDPDGLFAYGPDGQQYSTYTNKQLSGLQARLRLYCANSIAVSYAQNGIFPNETFGFEFDKEQGVYHTTFDCWQGSLFDGKLGYNDFYDVAFDLGTSMSTVKFDFRSNDKDYIIWGWKGDYLNLGAGCEVGIYEKADGIAGVLGHYNVNKDLAMDMNLELTYQGNVIGNYEGKHWWPSIFNPFKQNVNADNLSCQCKINFGENEQFYKDFKDYNIEKKNCTFDDENSTVTIKY